MQSDLLSLKMRGVIRLTRWREFVPFVIPVTAFGAILAVQAQHRAALDWRLIVVIVANLLVVAYGFMINDIEDAPDDAREAHRAARNPVASGEITPWQGWMASGGVALVTLVLYAVAGLWPFIIGFLTLALCHLYSWKPVRLKAWPVTDVLSHSLMLSGLLFLSGYFAYDDSPGAVWLLALAATLTSVYGQLYNQLRDFDMDKAAGLKNTTIMVGKRNAQVLMYASMGAAALMAIYAIYMRIIPLWIVIVPFLAAPLLKVLPDILTTLAERLPLFTTPLMTLEHVLAHDMRGGVAADRSGNMQVQLLVIANLTIAVWLIATLLHIG